MNHDIVNYLNEKLASHMQGFIIVINNLGKNVEQAGGDIKLSLNNLAIKMDEASKASDRQANRMYWLTWALVATGILNVIAIIIQTYH